MFVEWDCKFTQKKISLRDHVLPVDIVQFNNAQTEIIMQCCDVFIVLQLLCGNQTTLIKLQEVAAFCFVTNVFSQYKLSNKKNWHQTFNATVLTHAVTDIRSPCLCGIKLRTPPTPPLLRTISDCPAVVKLGHAVVKSRMDRMIWTHSGRWSALGRSYTEPRVVFCWIRHGWLDVSWLQPLTRYLENHGRSREWESRGGGCGLEAGSVRETTALLKILRAV